jgi:hypothetical protein
MTQHASNPNGNDLMFGVDHIPDCPICGGRMEMVYNRGHQQVSVCVDCRSDLTVPTTAWGVLHRKQKRPA